MKAWLAWCLIVGAAAADAAPARVVSLAPAATEIMFALGAGDRIVGVTRYDTYPPAATALPKVGGLFDPDAEAIMALHPTLVVALPAAQKRVAWLSRAGTDIVVAPAETLDDMWALIATLGRRLGREKQAAALTMRLREAFAGLRAAAVHDHPEPLRALLLVGHRPYVAAGPGSFIDSLLPMAGATNALRSGGNYPVLDAEAMLAAHPDVVVNLVETPLQAPWLAHAHIRTVDARDEALMLPGPRLPEALRKLVTTLWPAPL